MIWREGEGGGGSLEIGRPRSRGWKNFGRRWTGVVGGLENWTIFQDVICVSYLNKFFHVSNPFKQSFESLSEQ